MSRTGRASAPWARRALAHDLPPSAHGSRAYVGRVAAALAAEDHSAMANARTPRAYTVADLQRASARENGGRS